MPRLISNPTPHQIAIFNHTARALVVQAAAGSGKTSTIVHKMALLPRGKKIIYLVFNKKNQVEAAERLEGTDVQASTFHSLALAALNSSGRRYNVKSGKIWSIWTDVLEMEKDDTKKYFGFVKKMMGLARAEGIGSLCEDTFEEWKALAFEHDVQVQGEDATITQGIALARKVLAESNRQALKSRVIDFDDMIYLPTHPDFSVRLPYADFIFVDEAQDLSPVQVELVAKMCGAKIGERVTSTKQIVTFVGDRWQAIYGWRGAASDAMDRIKERFAADELPLSVCFRCASSFVDLAASLGAPIESAPNAEIGTLLNWSKSQGSYTVEAGDTVLCRTTAPLVSNAYKLIKQGRKAIVLGREIGEGLKALAKQMKAKTINELRTKLGRWLTKELEKLEGREDKQQAVQDKVDCLTVLMDMLGPDEDTIDDLLAHVDSLFADEEILGHGRDDVPRINQGVTFSTIHKAKGLEWDRVVILDAHKMPAKWAKKDWQQQQERHCAYVAYTRAKSYMALVPSELFEITEAREAPKSMDHQLMGSMTD